MLAIEIIDKGFLELPTDIEITLNYNFDVFSFEITEGSWSVPYSVHATAHNLKLLGYANRPTAQKPAPQSVRLWHSGAVIAEGTQRIEVADEMIEGVLEFGNGNFWSMTKNVMLNKLPIRDYEFENTPDADVEAWLNASNSGTYPEYKFACPMIYVPNYATVNNLSDGFQGYLNFHRFGVIDYRESTKDYVIIQPYLCYILDEIAKHYGYAITQNYLAEHPEFKTLTLFSMKRQINPQPFYDWREYQFGFWLLPEIGVQELILAIEHMFCVRFIFKHNDKTFEIIDINEQLNSAVYEDITSFANITTNNSFEKNTEYILKQVIDTSDTFSEANKETDYNATRNEYVNELTTSDVEETEHKTESTYVAQSDTLQVIDLSSEPVNYRYYYYVQVPRCDFDNINKPEDKQKIPAKFVFYRGRINDHRVRVIQDLIPVPGYTYPYATASNLDDQGAQLPGCEHTLAWGGECGLYEKRWKNYFYWLQNIKTTHERNIDFSAAQIRNLKPYQKFRIKGVDYFIQKMQVSLGLTAIKQCRCELVSC